MAQVSESPHSEWEKMDRTLYFHLRYVKISQSPKCTQQEHSRNSNQNRLIPQKKTETPQHIRSIDQKRSRWVRAIVRTVTSLSAHVAKIILGMNADR